MTILVTGGAGYIGSIAARILLDKRHKVIVVDDLSRGYKESVDSRSQFFEGKVQDSKFLDSVFKTQNFDAVMHFAGYISMEESMENPAIYLKNNTCGVVNLLETMKTYDVRSFIFSSTAGIYGNPLKIPIPEDHPKNPTNPYGESKLMVERILSWYYQIFGINYVCLRYFNAAGATLDTLLGERHNPETHIIPLAIKSALINTEFTIYGNDYQTSDKTAVRDYIHVVDLVDAHLLALEKLVNERGAFSYNVGTGIGHSNMEVVEVVKKITGIEFKVKFGKRRSGDAQELVADASKIRSDLQFIPQYSELETIVKTAWEWHKKLR